MGMRIKYQQLQNEKHNEARGCRDHNPGPGAGWLVGSSGR